MRRRIRVARSEESWLRFVLEAEDGLAVMTAEGDGIVSVFSPEQLSGALDRLLEDLSGEMEFELLDDSAA